MTFPETVKTTLWDIINEMSHSLSSFVKNPCVFLGCMFCCQGSQLLLFQLWPQAPDIFQCFVEFIFIRAAATKLECYISC